MHPPAADLDLEIVWVGVATDFEDTGPLERRTASGGCAVDPLRFHCQWLDEERVLSLSGPEAHMPSDPLAFASRGAEVIDGFVVPSDP
ncbi:MAG: hypothetical protein AAF566_05910 [Pseudomonadota bacterium]